ncbi:hypothetical protein ACRAWD_18720 [Caulobacter segnis]
MAFTFEAADLTNEVQDQVLRQQPTGVVLPRDRPRVLRRLPLHLLGRQRTARLFEPRRSALQARWPYIGPTPPGVGEPKSKAGSRGRRGVAGP